MALSTCFTQMDKNEYLKKQQNKGLVSSDDFKHYT
jgi:hypothetical protein